MNYAWGRIKSRLDKIGYHKDVVVSKAETSPPSVYDGFVESIGEPDLQTRDLRKRINGTESMHVKEYDNYYKVHRDKVDPKYDPISHLIEDSPEVPAGIAAAILSGYGAGKAHYENIRYTSEHPILESALVTLGSGAGTGILTYLGVKLLRELLEE